MDVMHTLSVALVLAMSVAAQQGPAGQGSGGTSDTGSKPAGGSSISPVRFDGNGWPVGFGGNSAPAPAGEVRSARPGKGKAPAAGARPKHDDRVIAEGTSAEPLASGMHLDSPLHDVFRATRSPGAMRQLGGVRAEWELTVYDQDGSEIGKRIYVHIADCAYPERDRLQYGDRVFVRDGSRVAAGRAGIPWDQLNATAKAELALFGLQLRLPWCFGDGRSYAILRREAAARRGEDLVKLTIERRPPASSEVFGPERQPRQRDQFELLYHPSTGTPRELLHRFAASGQQRRVLLDDWWDFEGVRMPRQRVYVDEATRMTTRMQLKKLQRLRVGDRDFRLL